MSNKNYLSIYAKSFNWAGFFLPKKIYLKCSSLYDFCRTVDNIADGNEILENKRKNF
jgi:phytoene synthase